PGTHTWSIPQALAAIREAGCGVTVLLNCAQDDEALEATIANAPPPVRAGRSHDLRTYGIGAQILRALGVGRMRWMAAPRKMPSMTGFGLEIAGYVERPQPCAPDGGERHRRILPCSAQSRSNGCAQR